VWRSSSRGKPVSQIPKVCNIHPVAHSEDRPRRESSWDGLAVLGREIPIRKGMVDRAERAKRRRWNVWFRVAFWVVRVWIRVSCSVALKVLLSGCT
jgi:hypothetical protein